MIIHTDGDPKFPAIVLLHPMLLSGRQMAEMLGRKIPGSYYLVTPDQGGHGEDKGGVFSAQQDARELQQFLLSQGISEVALLYAASMGGTTAMELLKLGGLHFRTVHLDGIPLAKYKGAFHTVLALLLMLLNRKKAQKDPEAVAKLIARQYGDELGKSMASQLADLSPDNIRRIEAICASGCAVPLEEKICGRMTFEWGEKEISLAESKPLVEKLYPWARIIVREGLGHCAYMARDPGAFAQELAKEIESAPD